jgi:predicted dehydrogenase
MTGSRLRLAMVGSGKAATQHLDAVRQVADFNVVAFLDIDPQRALPGVARAESTEQMLADFAPDAVALCVPPGVKSALAEHCLDAGLPLMLEKPPFMSLQQLQDVEQLRVAGTGRVPVHVMLQHRLALPPSFRRYQDQCGGGLGTLLVCRARPDSWFTGGWHADPALAHGGILSHLAIHYLDMAISVLGQPARFTIGPGTEDENGIERQITGTLSFEEGGQLALVVSGHLLARSETLVISTPDNSLGFIDGVPLDRARQDDFVAAEDLRGLAYRDFAAAIHAFQAGEAPPPAMLDLSTFHDLQRALDLIRGALDQRGAA